MRIYITLFLLFIGCVSFSETITGEIEKQSKIYTNQIYDKTTHVPIEGVLIKIPSKNYRTITDKDGSFKLQTKIDSPTIMSLEKSGYKPYSMTISSIPTTPLQVGIEKSNPHDIVVDTNMIHIGDNSFSEKSANASDFSLSSLGSFYSKNFQIKNFNPAKTLFLVIGSIIGIDTIVAQQLGQSHVSTAYSSPPEIFFNGNKISDIKINGDNQKIKIPYNLIKFNQNNNITIKTGRNLFKTSDIDFDDIEFTNLLLELK